MKVIIAYDGSSFADAAIDDLPRAGFPRDSELLVVSVADPSVSGPVVSEYDLISAATSRIESVLENARDHESQVVDEARNMASRVANELESRFPDWKIGSEVLLGNPADELLLKVDEWNADLIMGGSQGRSAIGRFFLGSVSKVAAEKASASVRIVRQPLEKTGDDPIEIILGTRDPADTERMVESVMRRNWPEGTRMRLVVTEDDRAGGAMAFYSDGKTIYETAAERLASSGITVSVQIQSGDAKAVLLEAAEAWRAEAIMISANSSGGFDLDQTAAALVTTAKCTVEIVR